MLVFLVGPASLYVRNNLKPGNSLLEFGPGHPYHWA